MEVQLNTPAPQGEPSEDTVDAAASQKVDRSDAVFSPAEFDLRMAMNFASNEHFWKGRITEINLSDTMVLGMQSGLVVSKSTGREKPIYDGLDAVISGILKKPISVLKLSNIGLNCTGVESVCRVLGSSNSSLTTLDISRNNIWQKGFRTLTNTLMHDSALHHLDCSRNAARDVGALKFAELLKRNRKLRTLSLADNFIFDEGGIALAKALLKNNHLSCLDLSKNRTTLVSNYAFDKVLLKNTTIENLKLEGNDLRPNGSDSIANLAKEEEEVRQRILRTNHDSNNLRRTLHKIRKKEKELVKQFAVNKIEQGARVYSDEELEHLQRMETALSNRYHERKQQVDTLKQDIEELEQQMETNVKQMHLSIESKDHIDRLRFDVEKKTEELDETNLEHLRVIERLRERKSQVLEASLELDQKVATAEREASLAKTRYDEAEKVWISLRRKAVDTQIDIDSAHAEIHKLDKTNETRQTELLKHQMEHEDLQKKLQLSRQKREKAQAKLNVLVRRQSDAKESLQEALDIQTTTEKSMKELRNDSILVEGEMEQNQHDVDDSVVQFLEQRAREQLKEIEDLQEEKRNLQEETDRSNRHLKEARCEIQELKAHISKLESLRDAGMEQVVVDEEHDLSNATTPNTALSTIVKPTTLPSTESTRQMVWPIQRPKSTVQNNQANYEEQAASETVEFPSVTRSDVSGSPEVMEISVPLSPMPEPKKPIENCSVAQDLGIDHREPNSGSKDDHESRDQVDEFVDKAGDAAEDIKTNSKVVNEDSYEIQSNSSVEQSRDSKEYKAAQRSFPDRNSIEGDWKSGEPPTIQKQETQQVENPVRSASMDKVNRPLPVPKGKLSNLASSVLSQQFIGETRPVPDFGTSPPPAADTSTLQQSSSMTNDSFITESSESDPEEELKRVDRETVVEIHDKEQEPHGSALYPHERMQVHTKHVQFNLSKPNAQESENPGHEGCTLVDTAEEDAGEISSPASAQHAKTVEDDSSDDSRATDGDTRSSSFLLEASHNVQDAVEENQSDSEYSDLAADDTATSVDIAETGIDEKEVWEQKADDASVVYGDKADEKSQYRLRLEIGQVFGMKRQSTLRWSYPRYVWVSSDLKRLLWNKGECKSTRYESLPSWTFDEVVSHRKSKTKWKTISKFMRNDPARIVTLVNSGGKNDNVQLRCSTAVEAEMWRNTFSWWIKYTKSQGNDADQTTKEPSSSTLLESLSEDDLARIKKATASVVQEDIDDPQSTYKTMRLRVCDKVDMDLEGEGW